MNWNDLRQGGNVVDDVRLRAGGPAVGRRRDVLQQPARRETRLHRGQVPVQRQRPAGRHQNLGPHELGSVGPRERRHPLLVPHIQITPARPEASHDTGKPRLPAFPSLPPSSNHHMTTAINTTTSSSQITSQIQFNSIPLA